MKLLFGFSSLGKYSVTLAIFHYVQALPYPHHYDSAQQDHFNV